MQSLIKTILNATKSIQTLNLTSMKETLETHNFLQSLIKTILNATKSTSNLTQTLNLTSTKETLDRILEDNKQYIVEACCDKYIHS